MSIYFKLIRVQSAEGTKRVEITNETLSQLYEKVFKEFKIGAENESGWCLFADREKQNRLQNSKNTLANHLISHGDLIYLFKTAEEKQPVELNTNVEEDDIDIYLDKQSGVIKREKDELL